MTISAGGSSGIVFPDSTTLPASQVTTYLSPGLTDTANVLTANPSAKLVQFNGTTGLTVNGATLTSASGFYPVNTVAPAITGTTRDTQVLTCSTGTWSNTPTSYSYQWIRGTSTNIGTNSSTYTCVSADIGSTIKCTVTATNGVGSNSTTSSSVGPITANTYSATYFAVAGGGGGAGVGNYGAGGGGGGGTASGTTLFTPGVVYSVTIGGGGAGSTTGSNSTITGTGLTTITASGGGGTGGLSGGTSGNGNAGGSPTGDGNSGGGGGGAGGVGGNGSGNGEVGWPPGTGGSGVATSITGSSVYYGGGAGGDSFSAGAYPYNGGAGGGGWGAGNGTGVASRAVAGTVNTGGGGGGQGRGYGAGASGGSGAVIISVPTASYSNIKTGSPTVTTNGSNTVMKFTSSGTYTA